MNTQNLALKILQSLESIDYHLLESGCPEKDTALDEWNTTLPLLEDLTTKKHPTCKQSAILEDFQETKDAAKELQDEDEYPTGFIVGIKNLASTVLSSTKDMEEWSIYESEIDPETPMQLEEDSRIITLKRKIKRLEKKLEKAA